MPMPVPPPPRRQSSFGVAQRWAKLPPLGKVAVAVSAVVVVLLVIGVAVLSRRSRTREEPCYESGGTLYDQALCIHRKVPMADGHNDLPWAIRMDYAQDVEAVDLAVHQSALNTDMPRLQQGVVGMQGWSVYVSCEMQHVDAVRATLEQIDIVHQMIARYPDDLQLVLTADDIVAARARCGLVSVLLQFLSHTAYIFRR